MNTFSEEKLQNMDINNSQLVATNEQYVSFITNDIGETIVVPSSEEDYLKYLASPTTHANPNSGSKSWMKIYIIIIDDGSTMRLSATFDWLTQPTILFKTYDLLSIKWDNGSYIPNSAEGFYSYQSYMTGKQHTVSLSGFAQSEENFKQVNVCKLMNDSNVELSPFFHMMVRIQKNSGLNNETASAYYGHQDRAISVHPVAALGSAVSFAAALKAKGGSIYSMVICGAALTVLGSFSVDEYYEEFSVKAYYEY